MHASNNLASTAKYCLGSCFVFFLAIGCTTSTPDELPLVTGPHYLLDRGPAVLKTSAEAADTKLTSDPGSDVDTLIKQTFEEARILVETETDTQLRHVHLEIVAGSEINREVKRVSRMLVRSQFTNAAYAEMFLDQMINEQTSSYAALFTEEGNRVLINRDLIQIYLTIGEQTGTSAEQAVLALLIHELVHAADDFKYQIHKNRVMNFKISFTQSAAFEGHAQLVTRKICKKHNCLDGLRALDSFMFAPSESKDPSLQGVHAISRNVLEYSYIEGERFLTELMKRPDGEKLIENVLRNPPEDPIQILVPSTYPDRARERRNQRLRDAVLNSHHQWTYAPYRIVETSPIKGINVRNQPERRSAAIEGFSRLITAMESAQIYNQAMDSLTPLELTLIEAESNDTARLFTESFVQHAVDNTGQVQPVSKPIMVSDKAAPDGQQPGVVMLFMPDGTSSATSSNLVMIAVAGRYILQLTGSGSESPRVWMDFAESVFDRI